MAVPVDLGRGKITGNPVPVLDPVLVVPGNNGNSGIFVSAGGALITSRGGSRSQMMWLDRDGTQHPITSEVRSFGTPRLSPDGRRIAVLAADNQRTDVWIYDIGAGTLSRLTSSETVASVDWTPDGKYVVFVAQGDQARSAIYKQLAEGGSPAEKLYERPELTPDASMSPDGKWLLLTAYHENSWDLYRVHLDSGRTAQSYLTTRANEQGGRFSPDGKWVALTSNESGRSEVYVRSFPDPASRVQISVGGGGEAVWSADGTRLYYRSNDVLMQASVTLTPSFRVLSRDTVSSRMNVILAGGQTAGYQMSADGKRLLGLVSNKDDYQLVVVPNWRVELGQRLAANRSK
jgi:Tol biopolymer transport system component